MKASEFDKLFDEGECVIPYAEMDNTVKNGGGIGLNYVH